MTSVCLTPESAVPRTAICPPKGLTLRAFKLQFDRGDASAFCRSLPLFLLSCGLLLARYSPA